MSWEITCAGPKPLHGCCIVRSSHKITPKLYTSHFSLDGSPRRNSGAIHSGCSLPDFDLKNPKKKCNVRLVIEQNHIKLTVPATDLDDMKVVALNLDKPKSPT